MSDVKNPALDPDRWRTLFIVGISQLMLVLDSSIMNIALPHAKRTLHISDANQQWVVTAYTLAFGSLLLVGGRIGDFVGRKKVFIIGLLGFAGASAIGGIAGLIPTLDVIKYSKIILIANKESIICGWKFILKELNKYNCKFIPIDSEHFSIFNLIENKNLNSIKHIYLTASGGPFYGKNIKLSNI